MNAPLLSFSTLGTQIQGTQSFQIPGEVGTPRKVSTSRSTSTYDLRRNVELPPLPPDTDIAHTQIPQQRYVAPSAAAMRRISVTSDASVIQIWEGKVLRVDYKRAVMEAALEAKIGNIAPHTAEIELQWVSDQDTDLVQPGAIFYLTLFKRTRHGSIENAQELRFRRLPAWTSQQVAQVRQDAERMLSKMRAKPLAA